MKLLVLILLFTVSLNAQSVTWLTTPKDGIATGTVSNLPPFTISANSVLLAGIIYGRSLNDMDSIFALIWTIGFVVGCGTIFLTVAFWYCTKNKTHYKNGYQPTHSNLDEAKPPQGGSGVPQKPIPPPDKIISESGKVSVDSAGIYLTGFNAGKLACDTLGAYSRGFLSGQKSMMDTLTIEFQGRLKYKIFGTTIILYDSLDVR